MEFEREKHANLIHKLQNQIKLSLVKYEELEMLLQSRENELSECKGHLLEVKTK